VNVRRREPLPDALRAIALLGVLAVNAAGYAVAPWGPLLGHATPAGDVPALLVQGLQAWLLQGKAYPALAFLFGWGLAMALRDGSIAASRRARQRHWRMLGLGLLHGTLLYFGDILTMYALCGLLVLGQARLRWPALRLRLRLALAGAIATSLLSLLLAVWTPAQTEAAETTLQEVSSWAGFIRVNVSAFGWIGVVGLVFGWPVIWLCMLCGVAAARLRWLSHRRWAPLRRAFVKRWLPPLLLLNGAYAIGQVITSRTDAPRTWALDAVTPWVGLPLSACLLLGVAQRYHAGGLRWVEHFAPLGRRTLSVYVGHSLMCLVLYSGIGLSWQPGTVGVFGVSLCLWALLAWLAAHSRRRWPLEVWMGRRT
jgi:uncharacterized protein